MNKWGLWIIVAAVVLIGGAVYLMNSQQSATQIPPPVSEPTIVSPAPTGEVKT